MRVRVILAWIAVGGCGRVGFADLPDAGSVGSSCVTWSPFGAPVPVAEVGWTGDDWAPRVTSDELEMVLYSSRTGTVGSFDVFHATRESRTQPFGTPVSVVPVNSIDLEHVPFLSNDRLTLLFGSERAGGSGGIDVWMATRSAPGASFDAPIALTSINSASDDDAPWLSRDGLRLYFNSRRLTSSDLFVATRTTTADPFASPVPIAELNTMGTDRAPTLSADELEVFWTSDQGAGYDIWTATRASLAEPFGVPAQAATLNSILDDMFPAFGGDERLYFNYSTDDRGGDNAEVWVAERTCLD